MENTDAFLTQLAQYFEGRKVFDDATKVAYTLSLLRGKTAGKWAQAMAKEKESAEQLPAWVDDWEIFMLRFRGQFSDPDPTNTAIHKLGLLKQGTMTCDEFNNEFRILMVDTGYNDPALIQQYKAGLNPNLIRQVYGLAQMPKTLEGWFHWAARFDRQQRQYNRETAQKKVFTPTTTTTTFKPRSSAFSAPPSSIPPTTHTNTYTPAPRQSFPIPMEVDSTWKRAPTRQVICYRCKKPGHIQARCTSAINLASMDYNALQAYFTQKSAEHSASPTGPTISSSVSSDISSSSSTTTTLPSSDSQKDFM